MTSLISPFPLAGFGTMEYVDGTTKDMTQITINALNAGYRLLDCAELYESTKQVGAAINSFGMRDELTIISKLKGMPVEEDQAALISRVNAHLSDLQVNSVDVLLMHWPGPSQCDFNADAESFKEAANAEYYKKNIEKAWNNMILIQTQGLCKHIGVSNFYRGHLDFLISLCNEKNLPKPTMNEIFIDPCHPQFDYCDFMKSENIHVVAYRPLAFIPVMEMAGGMGDTTHAALVELAAANPDDGDVSKSPHDVVLSWLAKRGITTLVKTASVERCSSNFASANKGMVIENERELFGASEMVAMCGGTDPYADVFEEIATTF